MLSVGLDTSFFISRLSIITLLGDFTASNFSFSRMLDFNPLWISPPSGQTAFPEEFREGLLLFQQQVNLQIKINKGSSHLLLCKLVVCVLVMSVAAILLQ